MKMQDQQRAKEAPSVGYGFSDDEAGEACELDLDTIKTGSPNRDHRSHELGLRAYDQVSKGSR